MAEAIKSTTGKKESYGLTAVWLQLSEVSYISRPERILQMLKEALRSVCANPLTALFSLVSISSALFVLGMFLLIFQNIEQVTQSSVRRLNLSVYLRDKLSSGDITELQRLVSDMPGVAEVTHWSKSEALERFSSAMSDFDQAVIGLNEKNPLPASLEITLSESVTRPALSQLVNGLQDLPGILHVGYAAEVFDRAQHFFAFFKLTGTAIVLIMLLVTAFVIGSTIRMMLLQRENELAIMRLVGATSFSIRIPCLLEGAFFGLAGSIIAIGAVRIFFEGLSASAYSLSEYMPMFSQLTFLNIFGISMVVLVGTGIGVLSSFVAARKV